MRQTVRSVLVLSIVFIAAGTILTLENMGIISGVSKVWPIFLCILGCGFFIIFFERRKNDLSLLFLGTILSLHGVFFFYLNYSTWKKTGTLWPIFLGIAGAGFLTMYLSSKDRLFLFLALGLIMLAALFYLVFGVSLHLWPLSLVAFGISLLLVNHYYIRK
jgi:hypothetical protein